MRVLICGDRHWGSHPGDEELLRKRMSRLFEGTVVIEGEASGADSMARDVAEEMGFEVEKYPADWGQYGRAAGPIRNKQMIAEGEPDKVIAFHRTIEKSRGTKNMVTQAKRAGIPTEVVRR